MDRSGWTDGSKSWINVEEVAFHESKYGSKGRIDGGESWIEQGIRRTVWTHGSKG